RRLLRQRPARLGGGSIQRPAGEESSVRACLIQSFARARKNAPPTRGGASGRKRDYCAGAGAAGGVSEPAAGGGTVVLSAGGAASGAGAGAVASGAGVMA